MEIPEILATLSEYTGRFPSEAVAEAVSKKEEITPHLLRALENVANGGDQVDDRADHLALYAAYLLAQFREKAAFRLLLKIASFPEEKVDFVFGGSITEGLHEILASVFDGDTNAINELILNPEAYEFVRGAAIETYLVLAHTGIISREAACEQFKLLFAGLEREPGQAWNALVCAVGDLPAPEFLAEVREAFDADLIDPWCVEFEDIEDDAARIFDEVVAAGKKEHRRHLIENAADEISWWAAFADDADESVRSDTGKI